MMALAREEAKKRMEDYQDYVSIHVMMALAREDGKRVLYESG